MKKRYILAFVFTILFIINTVIVLNGSYANVDNHIYNFLISFRCDIIDIIFKTFTKFANVTTICIFVIILLLVFKEKERYILGLQVVITLLFNNILKNILKRPRPEILRLIKQGGYSYPSGHAMISIAVYGFLIYYVYQNIDHKLVKYLLVSSLTVIIFGVGISRIYLGVHYFSDIVGGFLLATAINILVLDKCSKVLGG